MSYTVNDVDILRDLSVNSITFKNSDTDANISCQNSSDFTPLGNTFVTADFCIRSDNQGTNKRPLLINPWSGGESGGVVIGSRDASSLKGFSGGNYMLDVNGMIKCSTPPTANNDTSVATTAFVKAQSYATETWVNAKSYLTSSSLSGYLTSSSLSDYATKSWVEAKSYLTSSSLSGYLTSSSLNDYATKLSFNVTQIYNNESFTRTGNDNTVPDAVFGFAKGKKLIQLSYRELAEYGWDGNHKLTFTIKNFDSTTTYYSFVQNYVNGTNGQYDYSTVSFPLLTDSINATTLRFSVKITGVCNNYNMFMTCLNIPT